MAEHLKHETVSLRGRRVYLRPPHKETDLVFVQRWINDPRVRRYLNQQPPFSMAAEEKWFDQLADRSDIRFTICLFDGSPIGGTGIRDISAINRTAVTGTWLAYPYMGRGYGTDAKMHLLKYAFDTLNLRKVLSTVIDANGRSIGHNLNCGYRVEGRRRKQVFVGGRYHDEVLLACFREWWAPKWKKYLRER